MADALTTTDLMRFGLSISIAMVNIFGAYSSFHIERKHGFLPMFSVVLGLTGTCMVFLGASVSGLGKEYPALLAMAPIFSGYIAPALYIYIRPVSYTHLTLPTILLV